MLVALAVLVAAVYQEIETLVAQEVPMVAPDLPEPVDHIVGPVVLVREAQLVNSVKLLENFMLVAVAAEEESLVLAVREAAVLASRGDLLPARRAQVERLMGLLMELSREEQT